MTKRRKVIAVLWCLVAIGAGAGIFFIFGSQLGIGRDAASPSNVQASEATPNSLRRSSIAALGRIEPSSRIIGVGAPIADRLDRLLVVEGQEVKQGEVLGYLDQYEELRASYDEYVAQLDEARDLLRADTALFEAKIEEARINAQRVRALQPLEIKAKKAQIRRLRAELANNRDILQSNKALLKKRARSRRSFDNQRTVVVKSEESLKQSLAELERLEAKFELDLEQSRIDIRRAKADLTRAKANTKVSSLEMKVRLAEAHIRRATIRAPIDGTILKILVRPGERTGQTPILNMGSTEKMHAVAEVYQTDIADVKIGQRASVINPALGEPLEGKVIEIARIIYKNDVLNVDPAADVDARVVEVRVELIDSARARHLTNLIVDVIIHLDGADIASGMAGRK